MGKAPSFQFYPMDWRRDLEEHPLEVEGAWIRICCKLFWAKNRGELTKPIEQWVKILGVPKTKTLKIINYIKDNEIGEVFVRSNGNITIISRRMQREEKEKLNNRERQKKHYHKHKSNKNLTPPSSSSSSTSLKKKTREKEREKNPVDNSCPFLNKNQKHKTPINTLCYFVKKRWHYNGCEEAEQKNCERFFTDCLAEFSKAKGVKNTGAYLNKLVENKLNEDGELYFKRGRNEN